MSKEFDIVALVFRVIGMKIESISTSLYAICMGNAIIHVNYVNSNQ